MPVQMIELEEVQMVEVSDSNLEALGITADAGYGYSISDCASWLFYQPLKGVVFFLHLQKIAHPSYQRVSPNNDLANNETVKAIFHNFFNFLNN